MGGWAWLANRTASHQPQEWSLEKREGRACRIGESTPELCAEELTGRKEGQVPDQHGGAVMPSPQSIQPTSNQPPCNAGCRQQLSPHHVSQLPSLSSSRLPGERPVFPSHAKHTLAASGTSGKPATPKEAPVLEINSTKQIAPETSRSSGHSSLEYTSWYVSWTLASPKNRRALV